jgi:hypothetical protein
VGRHGRDGGDALAGEVVETLVAGRLGAAQHACIGHAPLVRQDLEIGARQRDACRQLAEIGHALARVGVDDRNRARLEQIGVHALERGANLRGGRRFVPRWIVHLQAAGVDPGILLRRGVDLVGRRLRRGESADHGKSGAGAQ